MRAVIGLFSQADQAREALDSFAIFRNARERIRVLAHQDDAETFDRVMSDYNVQVNNVEQHGGRTLLVLNVVSTADVNRARDLMVAHGALTVLSRSRVWPDALVIQLD